MVKPKVKLNAKGEIASVVITQGGATGQPYLNDKIVVAGTPADLIAQYTELDDYLSGQNKAFAEFCKPHKEKLDAIKNRILELLNEQQCESFKTDVGTAYKSTITTPKLVDNTAFLDWVLEQWDQRGALLKIGAPQVDEFKTYMDENNGAMPPGTDVSHFTRVNIRRS